MPESLSLTTADAIGYLAATLTTMAFVPQVVKIWGTKTAAGLSMGMLTTFTAGVALWMVYGLEIGSMPTILANVATLFLNVLLIVLKLRHGRE